MPSPNISSVSPVIYGGAQNYHFCEWIDLGEVMQQALHKFREQKNTDIINRCERLPLVEANRAGITKVFETIVSMIGNHPTDGNRIFLYVVCEEENKEMADAGMVNGYKRYKINFHTNIDASASWRMIHQNALDECRAILEQHNAGFIVNEIKSTGCLFSISLSGKT